ncbi:TLC domain-containing protein 2-like [Mya arenaria]|uniref:TLC domain-containing protein 2-like n=1 Tax=Mya arenaria TaxID=6604 RepID=UPI0022E175ED|nr:TLC domain-containing protein 2-like [Mya arenaria]XP_052799988.1 TLC domain-containing protein 2-like [Mya arenaria]
MADDVQHYFDPHMYKGSENVELVTGYLAISAGLLTFTLINYAAIKIGPAHYMKGDIWRWRNTLVSWIHAVLVGTGVLYFLWIESVFGVDLVLFCEPGMYMLVAFSLGYFLHDFADHLVNNKLFSNYEVIIHHIGVIWSFWYNVHYQMYIPYTIIALMVEVNSVFLHARKLMQLNQWSFNHWLYKFVIVLNLITFVGFRLYGVYLVGKYVYIIWDKFTVVYQVFIVITMGVMYLINPILFWRLVKNDVIRNLRSSTMKSQQIGHVLNNNAKKDLNDESSHTH